MNNKLKIVFVILIGLLILGASYAFYNRSITEDVLEFTYTIEIEANETGYYSVYTPIPLWVGNGTIAEFIFENMKIIKGNAEINLIETEYGFALNVTSNNSITLMSHNKEIFSWGQKPRLTLSMVNITDINNPDLGNVEHFVKCFRNNQNQNISLSIKLDSSYTGSSSDLNYKSNPPPNAILIDGWQTIKGVAYIVVS